MRNYVVTGALLASLFCAPQAEAFSFTFDWSNLSKCTSGMPGSTGSPAFVITGAPKGTAKIKFNLKDLDALNFVHGGGTAAYAGKGQIAPGAFRYLRPCPPGKPHTYQWTAIALDGSGKAIDSAKVQARYPSAAQ